MALGKVDKSIHRQETADRMRNGGKLTAGERARLQQRLNRNSARIHRTKHGGTGK